MINLLTVKDKIEIKKEYLRRAGVVFGLFLFVAGVIAVTLLLPLFFMTNSYAKNYEMHLALTKKHLALSETADTIPEVKKLNYKLDIFQKGSGAARNITSIIKNIIIRKPSGISINSLLYTRGAGQEQADKISLSGISVTRNTLISFTKTLQKMTKVKNVESPASNLLKNRGIKFKLLIELNDYEK